MILQVPFSWKGGHAEPWGAVHGCGVVLASGRRSDVVSDVVPNNFCPSELADAQTHCSNGFNMSQTNYWKPEDWKDMERKKRMC